MGQFLHNRTQSTVYLHIYEVWEGYGDPRGSFILYMRFGKCKGTLGGHSYEVWEVYGDPRGVIGCRLYKVWEVYGDPSGVIGGRSIWDVRRDFCSV